MYYIGIDVGGMSIKAGLTDETGKIYAKGSVVTKRQDYEITVKEMADLCRRVAAEAGVQMKDVEAVGMGIPGTIDDERGVIIYANNLYFENIPIVAEFKKHIDIPVLVGNDANCAALGEVRFGSACGYKDAAFITLGTGVGSGIIIDGKLFTGKGGAGAEAGHTVIRVGGEPCTCGRKGCWEAYASATALIRMTAAAAKRNPESLLANMIQTDGKVSGRSAFKAARAGDRAGASVVNKYVRYIAEGLVNIVNVFRPEVLIIGGGISNEGDYLIRRLQRLVTRYSYGGKRNPYVKVVKAGLLNDAGILGAVALCLA